MERRKYSVITQKEKVKTIQKHVNKETQDNLSVDRNVSNHGLENLGRQNVSFDCLKDLETRVAEIFHLAKTANKSWLKGGRH